MDGLEIVHHPVHRAVIGVDVCLDGHACAVFDGVGGAFAQAIALQPDCPFYHTLVSRQKIIPLHDRQYKQPIDSHF